MSYENAWSDLRHTLANVKEYWINIDEKLRLNAQYGEVLWYCAYGDFALDLQNIDKIKQVTKDNSRILFHKIHDPEHGFYFKNSKNVFALHQTLVQLRKLYLTK